MRYLNLEHLETSPDFYWLEAEIGSVRHVFLYPIASDLLYWLNQVGFYNNRRQIGMPLVMSNNGYFYWNNQHVAVQTFDSVQAMFESKHFSFGTNIHNCLAFLEQHRPNLQRSTLAFTGIKSQQFVQQHTHLIDFFGHGNNISLFLTALQHCHNHRISQHQIHVAETPIKRKGLLSRWFGRKDADVAAK